MYCDYTYYPDNVGCVLIRRWLKKLLLNPDNVDYQANPVTAEYLSLMTEVWYEFDKIPYTANGTGHIITDFEADILQQLGIIN
jgi:hypothetical protein